MIADADVDSAARASSLGALLLFVAVLDELVIVLRGEQPELRASRSRSATRSGDFSEDV